MLLAISLGSAHAQILPQPQAQGSNIPQGSPVSDPSQGTTGTRRNDTTTDTTPAVTGERLEAVEVDGQTSQNDRNDTNRTTTDRVERNPRLKPLPPPNEFERFVERTAGRKLPRFGSDLLLPSNRDYATPATATVPPSYILNVGDKIQIGMTGSIEGSVQREIDTNGRIFLPKVGSIRLAGTRYGDLKETISRAIGLKYRNFTVNVGIDDLRGVRVYVTGFANNPGAYTVNSLSTMVNAVLAAGGPAAGGSFRSVKLYRNNELVSDFDLYQMLLRGDRSGDATLQNEDVLFIPPVGQQIAVTGSVNNEAIFEIKPGETLDQVLGYAGGTNSLADQSRLLLYRLANYDTIGAKQIDRAQAASTAAADGDIVQILSAGSLQRSVLRQSVVVRIEGEVNAPGNYYVPANTPLSEVLARAGGLTSRAYVYGTRYERVSEQRAQGEAFDQAIQQLEISLEASPLTADSAINTGDLAAQRASGRAVLERLRAIKPDGRLVLDITPETVALPGEFLLENNDRIVVPPRPITVGVFGAVYRPASFVLSDARGNRVEDYVERAGGALRAADRKEIFVVRANGDVVSRRRGAMKAQVLPGDVVFVPIKTQASSVWSKIRDISTIAFQFGIAAATVVALTR
ncbi:SLBB domain-containing protein [Sphingomonas sp. CFBP 8764]|uniref:SLBB domain-containing protein n=1 Tax=Sphingomonas sp. CFBP 8764 TaxID=2775275 RepID=UPI00177C1C61|nr:SLBB domain-containing protein [Sphingomonas sp. CFBP 8764]MBD8552692.1 SLBB domain-containing protein [Sphingomonas sp. CFBP 8764]